MVIMVLHWHGYYGLALAWLLWSFIGMVFSEHCTCGLSYGAAKQSKKSCYPHYNYVTWGTSNLLRRAAFYKAQERLKLIAESKFTAIGYQFCYS